jgi:hypothetical protein
MKTRKTFQFNFAPFFRNVSRSTVWAMLCLAVCILGLGVSAHAQWPPIIPINPSGAGTAAGLGTQAPGINTAGAVTGFYSDSRDVVHGFLRAPDGTITTFEAPGAGRESVTGFLGTTISGVYGGQGTYAISINAAGAITGFYADRKNVVHGFLRTPDGKFTTLDAPRLYAGTGAGQGTFPANINPAGVIAGNTVDEGGVMHGFVLADGKFTIFNATGAGDQSGQGTSPEWASCINPAGAITGLYIDEGNVMHGFVRAPDGYIAEFEYTSAGTLAGQGTWSTSINSAGATAAGYVDEGYVTHGLLRAPDGTMTEFDVTGAGSESGQGTQPMTINDAGVIAGTYINTAGAYHGFVRAPGGAITYFDVPYAGTGSGQGTVPLTNNDAGAISGLYIDGTGALHGFLRLPTP